MGSMIKSSHGARGWQGGEEGREESHPARGHAFQTRWTSPPGGTLLLVGVGLSPEQLHHGAARGRPPGPESNRSAAHADGPREAGPTLGPCASAASQAWAGGTSLLRPRCSLRGGWCLLRAQQWFSRLTGKWNPGTPEARGAVSWPFRHCRQSHEAGALEPACLPRMVQERCVGFWAARAEGAQCLHWSEAHG